MFSKKNKTLIIAEIGVNHDGNITRAKKLIRVAKSAGADYAKFQMYIPDEITTKYCQKTKPIINLLILILLCTNGLKPIKLITIIIN